MTVFNDNSSRSRSVGWCKTLVRVCFWTAMASVMLGGCVMVPRRPPPPRLLNDAAQAGISPDVRLLSISRQRYMHELPHLAAGLRKAAHGQPINVLALSGGGSFGAFGAGALVGLSHAKSRPTFQLVTGVSAGALLAPFAFLGPAWDPQLRKVFTSDALASLQHSGSTLSVLKRMLFPQGVGGHDPLAALVDRFVSDAMIDAVARQAETGRQLWIATTNVDDQETMFWNMGAIAEHGGRAARQLFRKILIASASIPGVFPPVLIPVTEDGKTYDEMHVDGSVTTPLFIAPVIALTTPAGTGFHGANVYVIIDGHMGKPEPSETPIDTIRILEDSFSAQLTYSTREALNEVIALARRGGMHLVFTSLPDTYAAGSFLDFHRKHLRRLFNYGESCAKRGLLWSSPAQGLRRDVYRPSDTDSVRMACPAKVSPNGRQLLCRSGTSVRVCAVGGDTRIEVWEGMPHGFVTNAGRGPAAARSLDATGALPATQLPYAVAVGRSWRFTTPSCNSLDGSSPPDGRLRHAR